VSVIFCLIIGRMYTDELAKLAVKFMKLEKKVSVVGETVADMVLAYRRIDTAFMKFNNLNTEFKDMSESAPLLREIKRAVEDGEKVTKLLERYKILPKNTAVTLCVTESG